MLNDCLKQATQHNGGKVYIKDAISGNSGKSLSVIESSSASNAQRNGHNLAASSTNTTQPVPVAISRALPQQNDANKTFNSNNSNDILNTIMQSIGIQVRFERF